jgi:hypothetical protein
MHTIGGATKLRTALMMTKGMKQITDTMTAGSQLGPNNEKKRGEK